MGDARRDPQPPPAEPARAADQKPPPAERVSPFERHAATEGVQGSFDIEYLYMWTRQGGAEKDAILKEQEAIRRDPASTAADLARFYKKHELHYRVRAHEKAHYWQSISTTYCIARTFQMGDCHRLLRDALQESAGQLDGIGVPLGPWIAGGTNIPERLQEAAQLFGLSRHFFGVADGIFPDAVNGKSVLQHLLKDSKGTGFGATVTHADPLGARALLEGAAKASEWIYWLAKGQATDREALADLAASLPIYKSAFIEFRKRLPAAPLLQALQAFVVTCDYALTLPLPAGRLWDFMAGQRPEDVLPGVRFRMLLDLWTASPPLSPASGKVQICEQLADLARRSLGWSGPAENCQAVFDQVEKSPSRRMEGLPEHPIWNPVHDILLALELRTKVPCALIAPVDAEYVNAMRLLPPELAWSNGALTTTDQQAVLTIGLRELNERLVWNLYDHGFLCPLRSSPVLGELFGCDGNCALKSDPPFGSMDEAWTALRQSHRCVLPGLVPDHLKFPYSKLKFIQD